MNYPASEKPELARHYVMGRLSHENATFMPDGRTVYMSDDDTVNYTNPKWNTNSGGVFFKFIADQKVDLSSGTLYAAKAKQDSGTDPNTTVFDINWIKLAHGINDQITKWI
jgi:secreted PhoX family phosphatase